jgi:hypothetical protein
MAVSIDQGEARGVAAVVDERVCSVCGRGQHALQPVGHSLRFLCPDEVCTECLVDEHAAA